MVCIIPVWPVAGHRDGGTIEHVRLPLFVLFVQYVCGGMTWLWLQSMHRLGALSPSCRLPVLVREAGW